ncbi:MAG: hypothetical protein R6V60_09605 [Desulfobacterales bacterium]|jgi:hypothetical protein
MQKKTPFRLVFAALIVIGFGTFAYLAAGGHPEQAWKAYLINFLIWSAIAQGGVLFSTLMHTVKARWSGPLAGLAEVFTGFFPVSLVLFLVLFLGGVHVFPWSHGHDLHGKEVWLNIPFLFTRDFFALLILYGLGFAYLYHSLLLKVDSADGEGFGRALFCKLRGGRRPDPEVIGRRMSVLAILYMLAFALVLSLIGYDLVMALDPHWISTLFGAYTFVKAIYVGLGGLIIFAAVMHLNPHNDFTLPSSHFHDIGKLFFAFCLVWADFFYVQLVVIWYGNIPEETAYVIERVMLVPWKRLAWVVFAVSFVIPFFILLNRKVKTMPAFMLVLAACMIAGIWLEHLLLVGPPLSHASHALPLGFSDLAITLGFLGLMVLTLNAFLRQFPELARTEKQEVR